MRAGGRRDGVARARGRGSRRGDAATWVSHGWDASAGDWWSQTSWQQNWHWQEQGSGATWQDVAGSSPSAPSAASAPQRRRRHDRRGGGGQEPPAAEAQCYRCGYPWHEHTSTELGPYKKWCLRRSAAGVVACFLDSETSELRFLFGEEARKDGGYNIFWGFAELEEALHSDTAARECEEESIGLLRPLPETLAELGYLADEVPIFAIDLGRIAGSELVARYEARRKQWLALTRRLEKLAPRGKQPGGDVMSRLFSVGAREFLSAAELAGRSGVNLGPLDAETSTRRIPQLGGPLSPRPPAAFLASALAAPQTAAARWLRGGLLAEPPLPLAAPGLCASLEVSREDSAGLIAGDVLAEQSNFALRWTGANGRLAPRLPSELAVDVAPLLRELARLESDGEGNGEQVKELARTYIKRLARRALDSPAVGAVILEHLDAFVKKLAESENDTQGRFALCGTLLGCVNEAIAEELRGEMAHFHGRAQSIGGDARAACAYRLLVAYVLLRRRGRSDAGSEAVAREAASLLAQASSQHPPPRQSAWLVQSPAVAHVLGDFEGGTVSAATSEKQRRLADGGGYRREVAENYDQVARTFAEREGDPERPREEFRELNNRLTRRVIETALRAAQCPCHLLVDAACGKGGGLPKYLPLLPRGSSCVLADISASSVEEAERRTRRFHKEGVLFACEVDDCFTPDYWQKYGDACVSAVSCQFALHYGFEDVARAEKMLAELSRALAPGAVFFGITTDAGRVLELWDAGTRSPGLFKLDSFQGPRGLGGNYFFELPGHVERTREFLVPMADLRRLAAAVDLEPLEDTTELFWRSFAALPEVQEAGRESAMLASLYCAFAFRKKGALQVPRPLPHDVARPDAAVALYMGSFDPFHLNHAALCRHVLDKANFKHVFLVPNADNPFKPDAEPVRHRIAMVRRGLRDAGIQERCTVLQSVAGDWRARLALSAISARQGGVVHFLIGQDSYESSLERAGELGRKRKKGIFTLCGSKCHILVMPRAGASAAAERIQVPREFEGVVHVLDDYRDAAPISSTAVREAIRHGTSLNGFLSDSVQQYIEQFQLYRATPKP